MFVIWRDAYKGRIQVLHEAKPAPSDDYHKETYCDTRIQAREYIYREYTPLVENYAYFWIDEAEKFESVAEKANGAPI